MVQPAAGVREGEREGPRGGGRIVVALREREGRLAARGHPGGEREPHHAPRREAHALAQAHDGVEQHAGGAGERAPVERLGVLRAAAPAEEVAAVALPLHRTLRPALLADDVHREELGVLRGARPAPTEQRVALGHVLRLDEELAEGGVGEVVGVRREHDLGVARDLELPRALAVVRHLQPAHLDVVLGRDGDVELRSDLVVGPLEGRLLHGEGDQVVRGFPGGRVVRRGPDPTAADVAQVEELAPGVAGRVLAKAGDGAPAAEARAAARVGDHGGVAAVREKLRVRKLGVRRAEAAVRRRRHRRREARLLVGARPDERGVARHALLQEQLRRLDARIGVEALHHAVAGQRVGDGRQGHPLVVREVRPHQSPSEAEPGRSRLGLLRVTGRVVDGLEVAVRSEEPLARQAAQVLGRGGGVDERGERGRVGRDHQLVAQAPLQAQPRDAERLVLVVAVVIDEVVGALGDPPGHAALGRVVPLPAHRHPATLVEQRVGVAAHQQQRHEVLEERGAPGQERRDPVHARDRPAQVEPVLLGDVALGDGEKLARRASEARRS